MTLSETLDEIAVHTGWVKWTYPGGVVKWGRGGMETQLTHPVPATLDAIAALWPNNWQYRSMWTGDGSMWVLTASTCYAPDRLWKTISSSGQSEIEARADLLMAVLMREASNPVKPDSSEGA